MVCACSSHTCFRSSGALPSQALGPLCRTAGGQTRPLRVRGRWEEQRQVGRACINRQHFTRYSNPNCGHLLLPCAGQRALSLASHPGSWAVVPAFGQQKGGSGGVAGGASSGAAGGWLCGAVELLLAESTVIVLLSDQSTFWAPCLLFS